MRLKKVGFDEIYKAIGRRFITMGSIGPKDVELVCMANGIYSDGLIKEIAEQSDNLHMVARLVQRQLEFKSAA